MLSSLNRKKIFLSIILFITSLFFKGNPKLILLLFSYLLCGYDVIISAFRKIFRGNFLDEKFLMTIASIGAIATKNYSEAAIVMIFFQLGEEFEHHAIHKSRNSIKNLLSLQSDISHTIKNGEIKDVDTEEVEKGEILIVKVGERIPLDGTVIEGSTSLDVSPLTGESLPQSAKEKDYVLSGSLNLSGVIKIKVDKTYKNSTVNKILEMVEQATEKKSNPEIFIKKFAKYYTPIVTISAVLLAFIPPLFFDIGNFSTWIYRAMIFLVISCPCALVISVPLSYFAGIGAASKKGVLVKGSNYLEKLAQVDTFVFDKTGTLTKGKFSVNNITVNDIEEDELLNLVAAAERLSNHPLSHCIIQEAEKRKNFKAYDATDIKEIAGHGIEAIVDKKRILVGTKNFLLKNRIKMTIKDPSINDMTTIYVAVNGEEKAIIETKDEIKSDSKATISNLKAKGINNFYLFTGDNERNAKAVSKELSIDNYKAKLLPQDKVSEMEKLIKTGNKVAFVGDGINDSPVLALSDVGFSMGAAGSDAAIEASDIVIMGDEISSLLHTLNISKKTMNIAKANIIFALVIKFSMLAMGALGYANMWEAIFADVGVSFLAILNSLRILRIK